MSCSRRFSIGSVVALIALVCGVAGATEDGGGRSVFAYGAGNRALALGGAYAAIADDASAVVWNPGGLGWVDRSQFSASHASLFGLGFSEQYASIVRPSFRWGVVSLSLRHFGVDGIERRDDRNVLLDENLSNSEFESSLGYGRAMGESWAIGGAVKLRRQSLAGISDTGLGLDAGVMLRPLGIIAPKSTIGRRLKMGLAIRNLFEPSLRLDQESVADPTGVRVGFAYTHFVGTGARLLAAMDFEKTSNLDARVHAGLELRFLSQLALRTGLNDGTFVAGSGVLWRGMSVDYAFEDNAVETVHRFGLSVAFGPTVHESRQRALAAEDEALRSKLEVALASRQRGWVEGLVAEAESFLELGNHDRALETVMSVRVLDPDEPRLIELETRSLRAKSAELEIQGDFAAASIELRRALELAPDDAGLGADLQRVLLASDLQAERSAQIHTVFTAAMDAFVAGKWDDAEADFQRVIQLSPEDAEASAMLERTQLARRRQAESILEQGRLRLELGDIAAAQRALVDAEALDAKARGITALSSAIARARRRPDPKPTEFEPAAPAVALEPSTPDVDAQSSVLSPERREEMEQLYRRALGAMEAGQAGQAMRYWEIVWSLDPDYEQVRDYLKREYLAQGMESFAEGRLDAAVQDWENALRVDPGDERALGYLQRARKQLERIEEILETGR